MRQSSQRFSLSPLLSLEVSSQVIAALSNEIEVFIATAAHSPLFMPLALMTLVLMKTVLQLGLYLIGYSAYGADDFSRSLNADFGCTIVDSISGGRAAWFGGAGWLPFS